MADVLQTPPLPSELPVVPLRGSVVLPLTVAPLGVSRAMSSEAINRALASDRMVGRAGYQTPARSRTKPGSTGSPARVAGLSNRSTGAFGR